MISWPQAKFFAYELTRCNRDDVLGGLSQALMNSQVDLQPHQVDAAAFALRSPLSKGVLLADEVGLGKTIEAGIVLSQFWAEGKRRLLIVCPASLCVQWSKELEEKFALPNVVVSGKNYIKGMLNLTDKITIMSYNFAANKESDLQTVAWDLVVMDEAHKLRNVYKNNNVIGNLLKTALNGRKKLLLTATPLQNSLLELFGLSQFIDDGIFGDRKSFGVQYSSAGRSEESDLAERLAMFCKRTLRKDVLEYIRYTQRQSSTFQFMPSQQEVQLHQRVQDFLQSDSIYALPVQQRHLIELVLYKLLASSTAAIQGTFETILERLENKRNGKETVVQDKKLGDLLDEADLIKDDDEENDESDSDCVDLVQLDKEICQVKELVDMCKNITRDEKTNTLLQALNVTFTQMQNSGDNNPPQKKALIFTESRRTQDYLFQVLAENGYKGKIVLFHGGNKDNRAELLQQFKDDAEIMIATEAGAEGLNMQFCSLVVNYDLPWNPQRVEQRIGRCHRYGQLHDVVVINFVNMANRADQRIFELLNEKFKLFQGVFGASDEVLGAIEDGVDIERKILQICKTCRTAADIERAFDELQREMEQSIEKRMHETKLKVLDLLDTDVINKMRINLDKTKQQLSMHQKMFWQLCKFVLDGDGVFDDNEFSFVLTNPELGRCQKYYFMTMDDKRGDVPNDQVLRLSHDISQTVINRAKQHISMPVRLVLDVTGNHTREIQLEQMRKNGVSGWCNCKLLTLNSLTKEEHLVLSGVDDNGQPIDAEVLKKLFRLQTVSETCCANMDMAKQTVMDDQVKQNVQRFLLGVRAKNKVFFNEEMDKISRYTTDKLIPLERQIKDNDSAIERLTRDMVTETDVKRMQLMRGELDKRQADKKTLRQAYWNLQEELEKHRGDIINGLSASLQTNETVQDLFTFQWELV